MWSFFRRLFPFLFPEQKSEEKPDTDKGLTFQIPTSEEEPQDSSGHSPVRLDVEGKKVLTLERKELTSDQTRGKLYWEGEEIAQTLEGPTPSPSFADRGSIVEGDYLLALRSEGGQHTSYTFRFKDWHKGMLHIQEAPGLPFAYLMMGNEAVNSYGNILLGTHFQDNFLLQSETAYRNVYPKLISQLEAGEEVILRIQNPS